EVHRPPQRDRTPLHRRTTETVRERRRDDRGTDDEAGAAQAGRSSLAEGRSPDLHGNFFEDAEESRRGGEARRRDRPLGSVGEDHRDRPRTAESIASRGARRRPETDGDPAPSREGPPDYRPDRSAILAPCLSATPAARGATASRDCSPSRSRESGRARFRTPRSEPS